MTTLLSDGIIKRSSILVTGHSNIKKLDAFGQEKKTAKASGYIHSRVIFCSHVAILLCFLHKLLP